MSILIKDLEMPKSCDDCEFIQRGYPNWCDLSCRCQDVFNPSIRPDWCPLEEFVPIKHGRWIDDEDTIYANCSECGWQIDTHYERGYLNYCPHCGAKMDLDGVEK